MAGETPTPFAGPMAAVGLAQAGSSLLFGNDTNTNVSANSTSALEQLFNQLVTTNQSSELSKEEKQVALENLIGQINETMKVSTVSLAEEEQTLARNNLDLISRTLMDSLSSDYSPEKATALAENARKRAIDSVLRTDMQEVIGAGVQAGAYDSTVQSNIATEVAARAAEKGAQAELTLQQTFASLAEQKANTLSGAMNNLFGILKGSEVTTNQSSNKQQESSTSSQNQVSGSQSGSNSSTTDTNSSNTQTSESNSSTKTEQDEQGLLDKLFG